MTREIWKKNHDRSSYRKLVFFVKFLPIISMVFPSLKRSSRSLWGQNARWLRYPFDHVSVDHCHVRCTIEINLWNNKLANNSRWPLACPKKFLVRIWKYLSISLPIKYFLDDRKIRWSGFTYGQLFLQQPKMDGSTECIKEAAASMNS